MYSIYKIHYKDLCYVGIAGNFKARMRRHKFNCLNQESVDYNRSLYQAIRVDGWEAWTKEVVETTDDKTKERYWIESIGNLNSYVPNRKRIERPEYKNKFDKITCECGGKYTRSNKSIHCKSNKHLNYINTNV